MCSKNLALNRPVYASEPADERFPVNKLNNGVLNIDDGYLTNKGNVQVLITIELEKSYIVNLIKLKQIMYSGNRRCKNFDVRYSDDNVNYTTIFSGVLENNDLMQSFKINNNTHHKYWGLFIKDRYDNGGTSYGIGEVELYYIPKFLINQNKNYYSTNSNFLNLGQPVDNIQLENWYNKYGSGDVNIITQNLNNKEFPMSKNENGIWKTDFQLDINDVTDNIDLVDINENNKSIKYDCNNYRILDLCDDEFDIMQYRQK
ncbi:discoidin domain-containing protein [Clostridium botulinum]|uniref:discoidin domain-containing protein n=1 Tax=Clostridium botulinum TaxID=1491 RepID=UPI001FA82BE3|nr:discoidin domain-containing protein [Clostridium botulinum]